MKITSNSNFPLIFAHRGASAEAPENTLSAFNLALEMGADGIELDVMLTKDGELVVIHDDTVDRTTNGSGKVIDHSYKSLRELDAGGKFSPKFRGEHLPTLAEVFEQMGGKLIINIELKNYASPFDSLTESVIDLIEAFNLNDSTLLSSFNPFNLSKAYKKNPSIKRGLLTFPKALGSLLRGPIGRIFPYDAMHPYYADVTSRMISKLHAMDQQVNVWTVDDPVELRLLASMGVDMIICNNPKAARQAIEVK